MNKTGNFRAKNTSRRKIAAGGVGNPGKSEHRKAHELTEQVHFRADVREGKDLVAAQDLVQVGVGVLELNVNPGAANGLIGAGPGGSREDGGLARDRRDPAGRHRMVRGKLDLEGDADAAFVVVPEDAGEVPRTEDVHRDGAVGEVP